MLFGFAGAIAGQLEKSWGHTSLGGKAKVAVVCTKKYAEICKRNTGCAKKNFIMFIMALKTGVIEPDASLISIMERLG